VGGAEAKAADKDAAEANVSLWQALRSGRLTRLGLEDVAQAFGLLAAVTPVLCFPFLSGLTNQSVFLLPSILSIEDIVVFSLELYVFLVLAPTLLAPVIVLFPAPLRWARRFAFVLAGTVMTLVLLQDGGVIDVVVFSDFVVSRLLWNICLCTFIGILLLRYDRMLHWVRFLPEFLRGFLSRRIRPALVMVWVTWILWAVPAYLGQLVGQFLETSPGTTIVLSGATCAWPRLIFNGAKASIYSCGDGRRQQYVIYFPEERASMITSGTIYRVLPSLRASPAPARPGPGPTPAPAPGRSL
jgi:hypothetical protein